MQAVASTETTPVKMVRAEGTGWRTDYIGSPGIIDENPQAFLVDRLYPGAEIPPHFHDIDQFQVVVAGDCTMGKKAAGPVTFQYADAYTPYGPIIGKKEGFAFFTLRPIASGGFFGMPGNRHNMPGRAGRNMAGHFAMAAPRPAAGQVEHQPMIENQTDGVAAVGLRLGPGAKTGGPRSDAGGQYYLVCEGEVMQGEKVLPRHSLVYVAPGETAPAFDAGPEGADVLFLQFARPSERPGSDPKQLAARDPDAYLHRQDDAPSKG